MTATMEAPTAQTPDDIARQALRVFRRNLRHYEGIASAIAGRKIRVVPSDHSRTDGDIIYLGVPMALGKKIAHSKGLCDKRDPETMAQLCLSCRLKERVHIELMHEISHVIMGSFDEPDKAARDIMFRLFDDVIDSERFTEHFKAKVEETLADPNPTYWKLCGTINSYFQQVLNAVEDVRVNSAMMEVRRGTAPMFHALLATGLKAQKDIHHDKDEELSWRDAPLNFQVLGALVMQASGFPPLDFCDKVLTDMQDEELSDLISQIRYTLSVHEAFGLAMPILRCLHRLGYFKGPEDEDLSEPPPLPPQEDEEQDEDEQEPDESDSSGSSSSPETDDSEGEGASEESESGEGDNGDEEGDSGSGGDDEADSDEEDGDSSGDPSAGNDGEGTDTNQDTPSPNGGDSGTDPGEPGDGQGTPKTGDTPSSPDSSDGEPNMGTPEEVEELYRQFSGHEHMAVDGKPVEESAIDSMGEDDGEESDDGEEVEVYNDDDTDEYAQMRPSGGFSGENESPVELRRALQQLDFFDAPSTNVKGVIERHYDPDNLTGPWDPEEGIYWRENVYNIDVSQRLLAPALNRLRMVFTENNARQHERGLKKGKLDSRALGRKIPVGNHTIFHKRRFPQGKDHAVVIGLDISGSTAGRNGKVIQHIKESAWAMAELLDRLGVKFCMFAHSGSYPGDYYSIDRYDPEGFVSVDISIIKEWEDPWGVKQKAALKGLGPFSANLDGHTLEYYRKRAQRVDATDKWVFYFTDGAMPAENRVEELEILQREIATCKKLGIKLVGVGIGNDDPKAHGLDTIRMDSAEEIGVLVDGLRKRIE